MRALVTGAGGFAGSHLAEYLLANTDFEVLGAGLAAAAPQGIAAGLRYTSLELRDPASVVAFIRDTEPGRIYHLAGQAFVPASWDDPWATFEANVHTTLNILEAVRHAGRQPEQAPRILIVSSMEIYGQTHADGPSLTEQQPFWPETPYSVSKVAQDLLGLTYHLALGLHVVRARPLNHIGPRQSERFVATAFARQLARIEAGLQSPEMRVGNLAARRDFTDVRDMVRAYYLALEYGEQGAAYNIGSGQTYSIQQLLDELLAISTAEVRVQVDPAHWRPSSPSAVTADLSKLQAVTGWRPEIPLKQTLRDLLAYERDRVKQQTQKECR